MLCDAVWVLNQTWLDECMSGPVLDATESQKYRVSCIHVQPYHNCNVLLLHLHLQEVFPAAGSVTVLLPTGTLLIQSCIKGFDNGDKMAHAE